MVILFLTIFFKISIDIITREISVKYDQDKTLDLNIYEIRINDNLIKNKSYIDNLLFDCQCSLFLVDITNQESFLLIQNLIKNIEMKKYPYLKIILVINKLDQENIREISEFEIKEFLECNKTSIDSIKISIKNGNNIKELIKKLNTIINESTNEPPINKVLVAQKIIKGFSNSSNSLSFILIGDTSVGKKSFINTYCKKEFEDKFLSTIGIDKEAKNIKILNEEYKLTIWSTAGQERFRCLPKKYYQNSDGIFVLFDITNKESFREISNWINDIKENNLSKENNNIIYIIGNKIDLEDKREVNKEEVEEYAKSLGLKYFEISCKINLNIQEVMARMIMECYMQINNIKDTKDCFDLRQVQKEEKNNKKKGCH